MTDDEINVEIAKLCGYTNIRYDWINGCDCIKDWIHDKGRGIPYYADDFNAIAKAEKLIPDSLYDVWTQYLDETKRAFGKLSYLRMTARQRAEALLKVFGKWKNE